MILIYRYKSNPKATVCHVHFLKNHLQAKSTVEFIVFFSEHRQDGLFKLIALMYNIYVILFLSAAVLKLKADILYYSTMSQSDMIYQIYQSNCYKSLSYDLSLKIRSFFNKSQTRMLQLENRVKYLDMLISLSFSCYNILHHVNIVGC